MWRSIDPEGAGWTFDRHLLAGIYDGVQLTAWLNTDTKKTTRPKPVPRPADRAAANRTHARLLEIRERRRAEIAQMEGD